MLDEFDFSVLNDREFGEDSVREEILVPLIRELGYSATGTNRIIRSRRLQHPFVAIGSGRVKISIIPDYLLLIDDKPLLVLEAKSPTESLTKSRHCEQSYSYAIHPEIRAKYYALCNGAQFVLFYIGRFEPLLHFRMEEINHYLPKLRKLLHPDSLAHPELLEYKLDYGLFLLKHGKRPGFIFHAHKVHTNIISKISNTHFTTSTVVSFGQHEFLVSFDFEQRLLSELLRCLSHSLAKRVTIALERQPFQICLEKEEFLFGVASVLGNEIQENKEEQYLPFIVKEFWPYSIEC